MSVLYIIATPIGNLDDITIRAKRILSEVDVIAAEDKRHTGKLLAHLGVNNKLVAYHDHNETSMSEQLVNMLLKGESVALVSDAGTPLIADPGYRLVRQASSMGIEVVPVPGPSALITALSVAGLPSDKFTFYGFLPAKNKALTDFLESVKDDTATSIFYESPHRIVRTLSVLEEVFGQARALVVARELTKTFEQVVRCSIGEMKEKFEAGEVVVKGEFVLLLEGQNNALPQIAHKELLAALILELPLKKATEITSKLTGQSKKTLYKLGLSLKDAGEQE